MTISLPHTADVSLRPLVHPARADAADDARFRAYADIRNAVLLELTGRDDDTLSPVELLGLLADSPDLRRRQWTIERSGEVIGCAALNFPQEPGSRFTMWTISLPRSEWGQGIGSAVLEELEAATRADGRSVMQLWAEQPASDGPRLEAVTGFGSVPQDHISRFLQRHGHTLEQVERVSHFTWEADSRTRLQRLYDDAAAHAGEYRIVQWMLPTPSERVEGYAWMKSRMSTDAPSAGLDADEEIWDAERVARHDQRSAEMGRSVQVTVAEHIATGELCAFNELSIGADPASTTQQDDTLVLSTHRGHRLGMLVKTAGLLGWRERFPDSPRVITWNAEENRPMLSINEAIGFVPISYEGAWKKELT